MTDHGGYLNSPRGEPNRTCCGEASPERDTIDQDTTALEEASRLLSQPRWAALVPGHLSHHWRATAYGMVRAACAAPTTRDYPAHQAAHEGRSRCPLCEQRVQ